MPTPSELANFYWHCAAVTQLIRHLPVNAATRRTSQFAIRSATMALTGRGGIPYASLAAQKTCDANGGKWEGCGLIREHAIPIGHMHRELAETLSLRRSATELVEARGRLDAELLAASMKASMIAAFPADPYIAFTVDFIRASTTLAWLTEGEDALLKKRLGDGSRSLNQRMPPGWDRKDHLARYRYCGIEVHPI